MLKFNEELLQFIWRHRLLLPKPLITKNGHEIRVIKQGELNVDSGPDFFNAQISLNGLTLVGNIELHLRTSDWLKHGHQLDKSYDNIILHVVYEHDVDLAQNVANNVEVLEIGDLIGNDTINRYYQLSTTKEKLPCKKQLPQVDDLKFSGWLERMAIERLEKKVEVIGQMFESCNKDYTQTFYTLLVKNFGFKVNALPFQLLASQLSLQLLLRHSDDLVQLEALLLGMAGLLDEQFESNYIRQLQNEFEYLQKKNSLIPLKKDIFKFSKLRPANFPSLRLAQLAVLIHKNRNLFMCPYELTTYTYLKRALEVSPEGYWKNHYTLSGSNTAVALRMGASSTENLMINTFAPFFFFYSKKTAQPQFATLALNLLSACASENNYKTRLFDGKKRQLQTATMSQGAIQLYDNYCSSKKCLSCGIAAAILNGNDSRLLIS